MKRLSLRNTRLKFKTIAGKSPIILEGVYRLYPSLIKENRRMSLCNRLDLQTLGSQTVMMPKNLPITDRNSSQLFSNPEAPYHPYFPYFDPLWLITSSIQVGGWLATLAAHHPLSSEWLVFWFITSCEGHFQHATLVHFSIHTEDVSFCTLELASTSRWVISHN